MVMRSGPCARGAVCARGIAQYSGRHSSARWRHLAGRAAGGEPEVSDADVALLIEQQVLRLDVSMHHMLRMRGEGGGGGVRGVGE